ncbi:ubiquitin C-terminal hydrolase 12-like [Salvia miltiorrhiza]|uniref:ubiquitin C-terminal hydrolase 12-like n=1 Tax=Salvia miltiorrhiza TaxID=226208 RepID=UPI0025AD10D8|nr:ubiquitin C-terminal hydrolase 12-like [Salvia miltiorrhiza]
MALLPPSKKLKTAEDQDQYTMETRDISPAHLLTKIESFSRLWNHETKTLESSEFESGDYKWKVTINLDDNGHISVYLSLVGTASLPAGWEVNVIFNFFLFNHISDNYLCFRGKARRIRAINPECGFYKLITKESLKEASHGYLFKDKCVFGAEVFVIKNQPPLVQNVRAHHVSINPYKQEWKISNFSKLEGMWKSEEFCTGGYKWYLF